MAVNTTALKALYTTSETSAQIKVDRWIVQKAKVYIVTCATDGRLNERARDDSPFCLSRPSQPSPHVPFSLNIILSFPFFFPSFFHCICLREKERIFLFRKERNTSSVIIPRTNKIASQRTWTEANWPSPRQVKFPTFSIIKIVPLSL